LLAIVKPKFHYADLAAKFADLVADFFYVLSQTEFH